MTARLPDPSGVRHGSPATAAADLAWLNRGIFISVGRRRPGAAISETDLVG